MELAALLVKEAGDPVDAETQVLLWRTKPNSSFAREPARGSWNEAFSDRLLAVDRSVPALPYAPNMLTGLGELVMKNSPPAAKTDQGVHARFNLRYLRRGRRRSLRYGRGTARP